MVACTRNIEICRSAYRKQVSYPDGFPDFETAGFDIDNPQLLRGVDPQVHQQITAEWNRFHRSKGGSPTTNDILDFADYIDQQYGGYMMWP